MRNTKFVVALTVLNVVLFVLSCRREATFASAQDTVPMLRGRGLQIVDEQGRVRASIQVIKSEASETSILRLADENGRPEVKLAASQNGSSLAITGATDANYLVVKADEKEAVIRAMQDGHEHRIAP